VAALLQRESVVEKRLSRKRFISNAAGYLAAVFGGAALSNSIGEHAAEAATDAPRWPWPYKRLDPEEARKLGHEACYELGCGYAGFAGIVKGLQERIGTPFTTLPLQMMSYGNGGLKGWGTVCGALNGAAAAISLVSDIRTSGVLIDELMRWYTQVAFPSDISNRYAEDHAFKTDKNIKGLPQSRSGSPLCHVSVTKWCIASGYAVDSPERAERCARLSGDVVAQAVKLLNDRDRVVFQPEHPLGAPVSGCMNCHGPGRSEKNVSARMDCLACHQDHKK
jgi:hypothetical protein